VNLMHSGQAEDTFSSCTVVAPEISGVQPPFSLVASPPLAMQCTKLGQFTFYKK